MVFGVAIEQDPFLGIEGVRLLRRRGAEIHGGEFLDVRIMLSVLSEFDPGENVQRSLNVVDGKRKAASDGS
jgi:hypothetical protein